MADLAADEIVHEFRFFRVHLDGHIHFFKPPVAMIPSYIDPYAGVGLPVETRVEGALLVHPFFGGTEDDAMWMYMCPMNEGLDDPRLQERKEHLERLGSERVLVFVVEEDRLMGVGVKYYEALRTSKWQGTAELVVNNGEGHCFHPSDSACQNSIELVYQRLKIKACSIIREVIFPCQPSYYSYMMMHMVHRVDV